MAFDEKKDRRMKEFDRLRSNEAEFGERPDVTYLLMRHLDDVRRMKIESLFLEDYGVLYYESVQSLADFFFAISDEKLRSDLEEIEGLFNTGKVECDKANMDLKEAQKVNERLYETGFVMKHWDFARKYLRVCLSFMQRKDIGFKELLSESI